MPSHKIHLKIAQEINKKLNLDNDSIMLGSVLPDLTIKKDHGLSHFQYIDKYPDNLASQNEFIKKYNNLINNPISIGYIIHLLTDRYYNDTIYKEFTAKGKIINKKDKHHLFDSYDNYLLKHNLVNGFNNTNVTKKIPKYKGIKFSKHQLKKYIKKTNFEIENTIQDDNYAIDNFNFLNDLYNNCIEYIFKELENMI